MGWGEWESIDQDQKLFINFKFVTHYRRNEKCWTNYIFCSERNKTNLHLGLFEFEL